MNRETINYIYKLPRLKSRVQYRIEYLPAYLYCVSEYSISQQVKYRKGIVFKCNTLQSEYRTLLMVSPVSHNEFRSMRIRNRFVSNVLIRFIAAESFPILERQRDFLAGHFGCGGTNSGRPRLPNARAGERMTVHG